MSFLVSQIKEHLLGMSHGGTLNKVRNIEALLQRAASKFLLKCHPLESIRTAPLAQAVYDDFNNYTPASDFGSLIDLFPQAERTSWDKAYRDNAGRFDLQKAIKNRVVSVEGAEGSKILRINWKNRASKVLHTMDSNSANGAWTAVGGATGITTDSITKYSGSHSIKFNIAALGDGIQNIAMTPVDMTNEDEVADVFIAFYIKNSTDLAHLTSITAIWGNDLTTAYWTGVAQTAQYDSTAFKVGWNIIKVPWSTATESGVGLVNPATIDAFKLTVAATGAITGIRVDNILFAIGRNFDHKYYSKYLFKNTDGTWISKPTSDDDSVMIDEDTLPMYLYECLKEMAHQMEGSDSAFDIQYAMAELKDLFPAYKGVYPSQVKKVSGRYGSSPARGRW